MWKGTLSDINLYTSNIIMTAELEEVNIKVIYPNIRHNPSVIAAQCWPVLASAGLRSSWAECPWSPGSAITWHKDCVIKNVTTDQ